MVSNAKKANVQMAQAAATANPTPAPPPAPNVGIRPSVGLTLLNGFTPDAAYGTPNPVTNIIPNPPNPYYQNDCTLAGGADGLGALPMGQGSQKYPNKAYICPIMVSARTPCLLNISYQWYRSWNSIVWYIVNTGTSWNVTQRNNSNGPQYDMNGLSLTYYNTIPSGAPWYEFYIYDCPGVVEGSLDTATTKKGDYIYGENSFLYQVQFSKDGGNTWWSANAMYVNQIYTVQVN
jgi:hypothetical protein